MSTLSHPRLRVHREYPRLAEVPEPIRYDSDPEPFYPSPTEEAYDTWYHLARSGEVGLWDRPMPSPGTIIPPEVMLAAMSGRHAGRRARETQEAREMGFALGRSGSGISEPPMGFLTHEKAAYRQGFQAGEAERRAEEEEELALDAWIAEREAEAFAAPEITDFDVYPPGCAS